jgi:hypothetical protein
MTKNIGFLLPDLNFEGVLNPFFLHLVSSKVLQELGKVRLVSKNAT